MLIAKVVGSVIANHKEKTLEGLKLLLLEKVNPKKMIGSEDYIVAVDPVGAGINEYVMYASGSSARQTELTDRKPVDAVIIGIIDQIDIDGNLLYNKGNE